VPNVSTRTRRARGEGVEECLDVGATAGFAVAALFGYRPRFAVLGVHVDVSDEKAGKAQPEER
jgi:hypothetical protein